MSASVRSILEAKGREVVTIGPNVTLAEAARTLDEHRIGAVVVVGMENRIVGIFTERDLVRSISGFGTGALEQPVSAMMTASVYRCNEGTTVNELMEVMSSRRFRHVPVEENGKLCGIVSIGDVVKSRMREVEAEAEHIKAYIAG
ncbi:MULTISPECIES: CBS domain-containing protein [Alphaproteobacteria]|uniref:Inosine-5-monophosphate dehydrogenase n=2 Tax=Alphaproteobacteria TaxID=28211 RepID=A0A512HCQ2_9HYPH|nr:MULTISPECIES: CBS domain-containing protein [Alphaproteobacteria]GEO83224.1 inosine-5-monophosphate dehydrogenase [Ciceribacter naphthalenivorans]GLR20381.1 inosine-5-monophosphate dehydrogenase [Ciceribacter naphthalenivorans]GLT03237.1 inosine-5-monophosphate dehydrogenase [Sphingomonas psychrolutea]